ncbi:ABC transporter permease [Mycetocola tolaasinivorans]|uniref:ABC transporter permease n=1 Tax=Mycetocola tolaasinivorans TaxID=76635 RepID=UPI001FE40D97|nr:ABC transporter permease [Mycetocola tolaasinivorans]
MNNTPAESAESRIARLSTEPFVSVGHNPGFFSGTRASIVDIWKHRELLGLLVRRELRAKYKDSRLGIVWSLARPLAQLLIYYFAIGQVLGAARNTPDFAIFVFIGLTMWALFTDILNTGVGSIVSNSGLVKKVYLPREIFPLAGVGSALFNFGVQLVILVIAFVALKAPPLPDYLLLAPLALITLVVFATAIGLALAALNVYLRDIQHFVELAITILFWASPIVYPLRFVHQHLHGNWLEQIYLNNPITLCIVSMQRALWSAGSTATHEDLVQYWPPNLEIRLLITLGISLVLLWLAQRLFARLQGSFAQEL